MQNEQFKKTKLFYQGALRELCDQCPNKEEVIAVTLRQLRAHIGGCDLDDGDGLTEAAALTAAVGSILEEIHDCTDDT